MRERKLLAGAILATFGVAGVVAFQSFQISRIENRIESARDRYRAADRLIGLLSDAETGQRGYLLTGSEIYLVPYTSATGQIEGALSTFMSLDRSPLSNEVAASVRAKLDELAKTIQLFRSGDKAAALSVVKTDLGNAIMMKLRHQLNQTGEFYDRQADDEKRRLATREILVSALSLVALTLIALALSVFAVRLRRTFSANERLAADIEERKEAYRLLALHLEDVREEERRQIARELHDELGQSLTGIKMDLASATIASGGNPEKFTRKLAEASLNADEAIRSIRRLATQLRPPQLDHLGLVDAVEVYAEQFSLRSGIEVRASLPHSRLPLDDAQNIALFRIVQESLTNVARHSQARQVRIDGTIESGRFVLTIADDGVGITSPDKPSHSLGILGMSERAKSVGGVLEVSSRHGAGTAIRVGVPVMAVLGANA